MSLFKKSMLLVALAGALTAASASASEIEAKVPFPFVVEGHTMPAGRYVFQRDEDHPAVLYIRGQGGAPSRTFALTEPVGSTDPAGDKPVLRFERHGSQYWLADYWRSSSDGWEVLGR